MAFISPAWPSLPWCGLFFLSTAIPSLTSSSPPRHGHPSLRMVTVSSWFNNCLVPEGETPGDATGFPMAEISPTEPEAKCSRRGPWRRICSLFPRFSPHFLSHFQSHQVTVLSLSPTAPLLCWHWVSVLARPPPPPELSIASWV